MDILNKTNIQNKILRAPEFGEETGGGGASSSSSNAINIGGVEVDKFYLGNSDNVKIYLGDTLLYPQTVSYKLVAKHSDLTEYKVACNASSVLTSAETKADSASASTRNVTIGDCVTELGAYTFNSFANLTGVTLPSGLTTIGERCFDSTHGITSITLPNSVVTINDSAFRHMHGLKELNIPSGVTTIPNMCFNDCTALSSFTIPSNITAISGSAFSYCTALKEVHFQGTTPPVLGTNVFNNSNIEKIYIPSCDSYDAYAANAKFSAYTDLIYAEDATKCKGESYPFVFKREHNGGSAYTRACDSSSATTLTSGMTRSGTSISVITGTSKQVTAITVGDCTKKVDTNAFSGWTKVSSITLSDSVQEIGSRAFYECGKTAGGANTTLKIGSGIKKLDYFCFGYNNEISNVILPGKTINFSSNTFSYCNALTGATFKEGFNISGTTSPVYYNGQSMFNQCKIAKVSLPNSLASIPPSMFYGNPITSLTIGSGVTIIGGNAFYNHKINNLVIPDNVVTIEGSAFKTTATTVFDSVKIGNGCTSIGSSALRYNFENIDIGSGITSISSYGIYNAKCKKLICRATTPPSCGTSAFGSWSADSVNYPQIYVPDESVNAYKSASFWSIHSSEIHPLSDLPS